MPVLARFYGIVMRMYFLGSEHNPPHVHAIYGDDTAAFDIRTGSVLEGHLPPRATEMVREWIALNREELVLMWETQQFRTLDPLD